MECPICKKKISATALAIAVGHWGGLFYKIFNNKPLTKQEEMMQRHQRLVDRQRCPLCRQKKPDALF